LTPSVLLCNFITGKKPLRAVKKDIGGRFTNPWQR